MKHPDLNISAFLIAHVNATGAALALTMSRVQATFRVGFLHKDRMHALARTQNWLMTSEKDPSTIDAIVLMFDPKTGRVEYTRCGKMGAVIVDRKGQPRGLPGDTAPPIGQTPNFEYVARVEQLNPGDTLGLYTRGVATCTNGEGKKFSELRFLETICDSFGESPSAILEDIATDLATFFAEGKHPDDITIMLLQRTG
jgi:serine phosphatase RsbU (regulator of sigma subunit)